MKIVITMIVTLGAAESHGDLNSNNNNSNLDT